MKAPIYISIYTDFIKLDSFLKLSGAAEDGAAAKRMIARGEVGVNGEICLMRGKKLYPGDKAEANGNIYEVIKDQGRF